jgi:CBS domain-containing protein
MTKNVLSFSPEDDLFEAIDLLLENHFAAAPVIDEDHCLLGMLTEKDCLRVLSNVAYEDDLLGGSVRDFQSAIRALCEPGMDIFRVADLFLSTNFPLLPVVEDGRLCGVVSRRDLLRGVGAFRKQIDRERFALESAAGHQADRPRSIESMQRAAANQSRDQLVRLFGRK